MKSKKLFLSIVSFMLMSTYLQAYTVSYRCIDRKDGFVLWVNIDENSLHYKAEQVYLFDYDKTIKVKDNTIVHFFTKSNIHYAVYQLSSNPMDIYIDDYKNNKLRYAYKCKLKKVFKNNSEIPITWRSVDDSKGILQQIVAK